MSLIFDCDFLEIPRVNLGAYARGKSSKGTFMMPLEALVILAPWELKYSQISAHTCLPSARRSPIFHPMGESVEG